MNRHLLVIDDEASIRELLTAYFLKRGYGISCAETAEETWEILMTETVDAVILDLGLGNDLDGMDLLLQINEERSDLPVIIFSGKGSKEELEEECISNGAFGFVSKIASLDELSERIDVALTPVNH